jgi:dTDP-4-amino-4,6-dideoxygalactose transaminase
VVTPWQHPDGHSSRHLYVIRLASGRSNSSHLSAFQLLREAGVGVNLHYIPIYLQPYYRALGFSPGYCPEAERYYAEAISLPIYYGLTDSQQDDVVSAVRKVFAS